MTLPNHLSSDRASHDAGHCAGFAHASVGSEHGTHVASVVIVQPGRSIPGIAPNATTRIFSIYRQGDVGLLLPSSQADQALAINRAVAEGAQPINDFGGRSTQTGQAEPILAVGPCDTDGEPLAVSNFGDGYAVNGNLAPGHEVTGASARVSRPTRACLRLAGQPEWWVP
jgi:hypothetical protein